MLGLGWGEILVIMVIALVIVGPEKLPELSRQLGRAVRQFRKVTGDAQEQLRSAINIDVNDLNPFSSVMSPSPNKSEGAVPSAFNEAPPAPVDLGPPTVTGRPAPVAPVAPSESGFGSSAPGEHAVTSGDGARLGLSPHTSPAPVDLGPPTP